MSVNNVNVFKHLCSSLFVKKLDSFFMLTAYFDDSNTSPNQRVAVIAGFLSSVARWNGFCQRWDNLLRKYGVKYVHRTDLQHGQGEFKGWSQSKRDEFIRKTHEIIKRYVYVPIGTAVVREDFDLIMPEVIKKNIGGVYGWCVSGCLAGVRSWCERHKYNNGIHYVFEAGTPGQGQVNKFLNNTYMDEESKREYHIIDFSFADKSLTPLQAADVIAYEVGRFALDINLQRERLNVVAYMRNLLGLKPEMEMELKYWDRTHLEEFVNNYKSGMPTN